MYKVLIVDDEQFVRRGLATCIDWAACGCEQPEVADSGEAAMEQIRRIQPDIVISDINMSSMSGLELVEQINVQYPDIRSILITGIYDFNSVYHAIKFDVIDLILKPTSPGRVREALSKAIQHIEAERQTGDMRAQLEQQSVQNWRLKQGILVSNLADGISEAGDSAAALASVGLTLHHYRMVTVLLYGGASGRSAASIQELEQTVCGYIDAIFEAMPYYCTFTGLHSFHILLDFEVPDPEMTSAVRRCCTELSKTIDSFTEYYSLIGISALHSDPAALHQARSESVSAANYAAYGKDDLAFVEFEQMPPFSGDIIHELSPYLDQLSVVLEQRDHAQAQAVLSDIFLYFADHKIQFELVRSIGILIAELCIRKLWDYHGGTTAAGLFSVRHEAYQNLLQCSHIRQLTEDLETIVQLMSEQLPAPGADTRRIVDQVEAYIRSHYTEELSLEKIASRYHISAGYLSRQFKMKKNIGLMSFVQAMRIERARELIDKTDLRTYEIAAAVGISDPVYFSKLFKRISGMRVRDYKNRIR